MLDIFKNPLVQQIFKSKQRLDKRANVHMIDVDHIQMTHIVPVTLRFKNKNGRAVVVKNTDVAFMRGIGLVL